ncbi:MAG TPA: hypothetical protein PKE26_10305 [Kiritimatiellia bacterium]|nr:hypothetical protein [Kiritimatiellia bacterium]HMO99490.1 hypothetical protein [Kiritimatiellia bacterium]HMP97999.1 hypothetical protein [Kiritimatiellia bacterium]
MTRRPIYHGDSEEDPFAGDDQYEECEVCHQEFRGVCPINSADCPYADDLEEEEEEDELPDFEDVEDLDDLIADDEEVEKIIEAEAEIPPEDLIDEESEEPEPEPEDDEHAGKTIEEIEAEAEEAARQKRAAKKSAAKPKAKAPAKPSAKKKKK